MSSEAWGEVAAVGGRLNLGAKALCAALLVLAAPSMGGVFEGGVGGVGGLRHAPLAVGGSVGFGVGLCAGWALELAGVSWASSGAFSIGMAAGASLMALRMAPGGRWAGLWPWMKPLGLAAALGWLSTLIFC